MSQLIDQFGTAIGGFAAMPAVRFATAAFELYVVLLWLACGWWAFQDMRRRQSTALAPYLAATFIVLSTPLLFPLAVTVYRIVRPAETLGEARYRRLEDRLADLHADETATCPDCAAPVAEDWLLCPSCRARLGHRCATCQRTMAADWSLCAWCGAEVDEPIALDAPATQPARPEPATEAQPAADQPVFQPQPEVVTA